MDKSKQILFQADVERAMKIYNITPKDMAKLLKMCLASWYRKFKTPTLFTVSEFVEILRFLKLKNEVGNYV